MYKIYKEILKFQIGRFAQIKGDLSEIGRYHMYDNKAVYTINHRHVYWNISLVYKSVNCAKMRPTSLTSF